MLYAGGDILDGSRIIELRTELNISQEELGERIGLSRSGVSNIEKGKRALNDRHIKLICSEFNVSEKWLRTGEGDMLVHQTRDEKIAHFIGQVLKEEGDTFKKRLINLLCALDEDDWEALEKIARKMEKGEY